ncbi:hypothetical protein RhiirA4_508542 [Rhizophagus irregularis]|uniref:P-loop containing nucleoside triphosphate hydrolase protein n=1 Tax=Rhizophagus irregularis TaxID=588596 RepID=A0A2I1HDE1_9GLOM|nr:hypothetical protein RhiirA4_508542 [Rhizophagus irregularis]
MAGGKNRNIGPHTRQKRDHNHPETLPASRLSVSEIKKSQQETTIMNFSSSGLTYNGSDRLVFIIDGEPIKTIWKRILEKNEPLNQKDIKMFVCSALVALDYKTGYEVEEIVIKLGNPDSGVKKLREIMNFPSMSCDASLDNKVLSFQYVVLPLLGLFTRTAIIECILEKYVLAIFMVVYENLDSFLYNKVLKMLEILVRRNSVCDSRISDDELLSCEPYSFIPSSLGVFFLIIVRLLTELLHRIKEASINETMHKITNELYRLKTMYQQSIEQQQFSTTDPLTSNLEIRNFFFMILEKEMKTMNKMLNNGCNNLMFDQNPEAKKLNVKLDQLYYKELVRRDAKRTYDSPGELSKYGKRHNNDFSDISKISIIPTKEEILCERPPFLPTLYPYSLHFLSDGAAKLLDTQFRLLREDLLNPIRDGLFNLLTVLLQEHSSNYNNIKLSKELKKLQDWGGRFSYDGVNESGDLQVYSNIKFANITCDRSKGFACTIKFTPPKISAKNTKCRKEFWERRLLTGSLVAVILPNPNPQERNTSINSSISNSDLYLLYFGIVVTRDERALSKDENYAEIDIKFIDPSIYPIVLSEISNFDKVNKTTSSKNRFMVESTDVYLESYYHILKTLQTTNPYLLPFEKYLAPNFDDMNNDEGSSNTLDITKVESPMYTRAPGFQFDLSILCKNQYNLQLNVANESTHDEVIKNIVKYSNISKLPNGAPYGLDESQAKALVFSLTREIALVEGPPGTVRLGSRSKSEKINEYNLEEACRDRVRVKKESYLLAKLYEEIERIEHNIEKINQFLIREWMKWNEINNYLRENEVRFFNKFNTVSEQDLPSWVLNTIKGKHPFEEWIKGVDIATINKRKNLALSPPKSGKKNDLIGTNQKLVKKEGTKNEMGASNNESQIDNNILNWLKNYNEPKSNRSLNELLHDLSIWGMSIVERKKLHDHWRAKIYKKVVEKLPILQESHEEKCKEVNDIYDETRRQVLLNSDVIGMTTNGAAKFQNLIRSIGPRIIICDNAGEVLEAHILSVLTRSTQHLILIGDHYQFRPHIATYCLSMDSQVGNNYQLDKSLFQKLVYGDKAVKIEKAQLLIQRRMRREVSDLIRYTIYSNLIDGDNTAKYENVRGAQHNIYFIDHRNPEDGSGGDFAIQSHANMYEVKMVVEMVKYFIRNGYTKKDDIAIITPYLGQMIKIRDALAKSFVVIDERDAQNIVKLEEQGRTNSNINASKKSLSQQVTLRTVDNFQGEEANIIIVSLVRNFSKLQSGYDSIGFLKSTNRSNVLLSRARKGMYLIGNSELMSMKSQDMWAPVINILHERNQVGFGMPIVCDRHPDYKNIIVEPDQFEKVSPCNRNCNTKLSCGHMCKFKCHADNPEHIGVKCDERCLILKPECNHQCQKRCFDNCGDCEFLIGNIILPGCGHVLKNAKCWQYQLKDLLKCKTLVPKKLLHCEHYKNFYVSIFIYICDIVYF